MAKQYLLETRYSYLEDMRFVRNVASYEVRDPSTSFEHEVQTSLSDARAAHLEDEFGLALQRYQALEARILSLIDPKLLADATRQPSWNPPGSVMVIDPLIKSTATTLVKMKPGISPTPSGTAGPDPLPDALAKALDPFERVGVRGAADPVVVDSLRTAAAAVDRGAWSEASAAYAMAAKVAGNTDPQLTGYLQLDMGVLAERGGDVAKGQALMQQAGKTFETAKVPDGQVKALRAEADLLQRQGKPTDAAGVSTRADGIARQFGIHPVVVSPSRSSIAAVSGATIGGTLIGGVRAAPILTTPLRPVLGLGADLPGGRAVAGAPGVASAAGIAGVAAAAPALTSFNADVAAAPSEIDGSTSTLRALSYIDTRESTMLTVLDGQGVPINLDLTLNRAASLTTLYERMATTTDLSLLHCQVQPPPILVAYLPYIYCFVLPMSIGDCLAAMGDYVGAEKRYQSVLAYKYLNQAVEVPRVWTRLADLYLAWGDSLYRAAGSTTAAFAPAAARYALIVAANNTIPATSPLYAPAPFATLKTRAAAIAAATAPLTLDDNPEVIGKILQARLKLQQIGAGLNFFGFGANYVPPFSFEYLQTTARYFAQHASAVEQSYIQFKSQAENEEFRLMQMEQQVEVSKASVKLEQLGLSEAQAGVAVANASLNYAEQQRLNAVKSQTDFAATRWELLQLTELEAWSSAAAQDADDEVHQTIPSSYEYYHTTDTRRSWVLQDLARQRTLISQDLEANRLAGEVAAAAAYKGVAQAQVTQANARVATANQRIVVAQLQQRQSEENRDFLDMKEFSARLWYELARTMRRLSNSYLDMAVEIAALMERAYTAETGRNLNKIRFDYRGATSAGLLGGDTLLRDIDFFTYDYITSTRSKKAPLKLSISLADTYPWAFAQLRNTGRAMFATTLQQFDRPYPGFYLHKVRDVELVFVGLTGSGAIHGTLRNIGVSTFRDRVGAIKQLVYPADVMPLSQYDVRQDALVFRADTKELRLFENNGVATMWQIDLPPGANDFDPAQIMDVQLVLYFDAFFDVGLETTVRAALPAKGKGSKLTSLRLNAPDDLFYLRSQGMGDVAVRADDVPRSQTATNRLTFILRVLGDAAVANNLTLRLTPISTGLPLTVTTDATGVVSGAPVATLLGRSVVDTLHIEARAADNPGKPAVDGHVDLRGLTDVQTLQDYEFTYR